MRKLLILPVIFYQRFISPFTPKSCRFEPNCSEYTIEAINKHGIWGVFLSSKRILRCNPLFKAGFDPVPEINSKKK